MPRPVSGTSEEREQHMLQIFKDFYSKPENAGKDLSVAKANAEFRKKYNSMLRNKKAYQLRSAALAQTRGTAAPQVTQAAREATNGQIAACLIEGSPEQLAWLRDRVLPQLKQSGLAQARVDHSTSVYAVLAKA